MRYVHRSTAIPGKREVDTGVQGRTITELRESSGSALLFLGVGDVEMVQVYPVLVHGSKSSLI